MGIFNPGFNASMVSAMAEDKDIVVLLRKFGALADEPASGLMLRAAGRIEELERAVVEIQAILGKAD